MKIDNEKNRPFIETDWFAYLSSSFILLSIFCFTIETLPNLSRDLRDILEIAEYVIVSVFAFEYLARVYYAKRKLSYVFSFFGIVDLLAILPFFLSFSVDLSTLRILRLLRFARILKLVRYNQAIKRFALALSNSKEELITFSLASIVLLYLSAVGIYHFEHEAQPDKFRSLFDCLWWAIATLTTVGYGEIYPVTAGGRVFTFFVLMIGLGLVAVPTGIFASSLSALKKKCVTSDETS